MNDEKFMKIAIDLSKKADYPYGAIVVKDGKVIGRSDAKTKITKSIFDHAEMIAIEDALKGESFSSIYYHHLEDFSVLDIVKKIKPDLHIIGGLLKDEALKVIMDHNDKIKKEDEKFIDVAIDLSSKSFYPFGAIVVRNGQIIGKSSDKVPIKETIYTHAELIAIESAVNNIKDYLSRGNLHECTLYTSCEPCMMCSEAILAEGISRVVYAATIEDSNNYFIHEYPVSLEEIVKRSNCQIKIIPELHRDKAIKVFKKKQK